MAETAEVFELGERVEVAPDVTAPLLEVRSRAICAGRCFWCEALLREDVRLRG
jgi:hypothetical protein